MLPDLNADDFILNLLLVAERFLRVLALYSSPKRINLGTGLLKFQFDIIHVYMQLTLPISRPLSAQRFWGLLYGLVGHSTLLCL